MRGSPTCATAALAAALALAAAAGSGCGADSSKARAERKPWQPSVDVIAPRNGARQRGSSVVVRVAVRNFHLAPAAFGDDPELGEGHIRFSLNRVPDCVDPVKLERALNSPIGRGRLVGRSFDFPFYAGPNGVLARRVGVAGSYSPATRPVIFYQHLFPGLYRVVINLAQNNGLPTPYHAVTNFQILPRPGHKPPPPCTGGKVPSAKAAAGFR